MNARERECARRRQRRAERLARAEREWILGHADSEYTDHEGRHVALSDETIILGRYFAHRCIAPHHARSAMVVELERLVLRPDWESSTEPDPAGATL